MKKKGEESQSLILCKAYQLLFINNWEQVTIEQMEKAIGKTRGSIFHYYKNKQQLFESIIQTLFLPFFQLSTSDKQIIASYDIPELFLNYKTPFDRIKEDIKWRYHEPKPESALFNIILQASKYYPSFNEILTELINAEMLYIKRIILKSDNFSGETIFKSLFALRLGVLILDVYCPFNGIIGDYFTQIIPLIKNNS